MTPIESGSTVDQRVRTGIFLLMCLGMGGWFAYDGFYGYAAKNLEWAARNLPERPPDLAADPEATKTRLDQVKTGDTPDQIRQLLGEPTLETPRTLLFVGQDVIVNVSINDQGEVLRKSIEPAGPGTNKGMAGIDVTRERAEYVKVGGTEEEARALLGQPASVRDRTMWYIGPAAYGEFRIVDGKVSDTSHVEENEHRSEWQIMLQKLIATCVGLAGLYALFRFWQALRMRVLVDETGMTYNGLHIPWDAMVALNTDRYQEKAWVDLQYRQGTSERSLRLDALLIQEFKEIMAAICQRKGFTMPTRSSGSHDADLGPTA